MYLNKPNPKAFMEYSNAMDEVVFMKLYLEIVFITRSYVSVPIKVILNSIHYLIMQILNKKELKSISINLSADIYYKDFENIYRKCTSEPYSFDY